MLDFAHLQPAGIHHTQVKQFLALKKNSTRTDKLVAIEGINMLSHAVRANREISALFVCPTLLRTAEHAGIVTRLIQQHVPLFHVSEKVLSQMVEWEGPDGLAAIVSLPQYSWQSIQLANYNALLVLDGLQIPGNIGTIIRCADGAGIDGIIITNRKQRPGHPKIVRASMGSIFTFPVIEADTATAITWLRQHDFTIAITDTAATLNYRHFDYHTRVAVVMGNERNGVSQSWYNAPHTGVMIPMYGRADSLNVGNAAALMLYEMIHQQKS